MNGRPWTAAEVKRIEAMMAEGVSRQEIAARIGRTYNALALKLHAMSATKRRAPSPAPPTGREWTASDDKRLTQIYNGSCMFMREMAEELGRSVSSVRSRVQFLKREGKLINRRERGVYRGRYSVPQHAHPIVRRFFGEMNAQLTTPEEIARRAGIGEGTIIGWRHLNNPALECLDAALGALGYELTIRPIRDTACGSCSTDGRRKYAQPMEGHHGRAP